jgi:hypothetical protein
VHQQAAACLRESRGRWRGSSIVPRPAALRVPYSSADVESLDSDASLRLTKAASRLRTSVLLAGSNTLLGVTMIIWGKRAT